MREKIAADRKKAAATSSPKKEIAPAKKEDVIPISVPAPAPAPIVSTPPPAELAALSDISLLSVDFEIPNQALIGISPTPLASAVLYTDTDLAKARQQGIEQAAMEGMRWTISPSLSRAFFFF